MGTGRRRGYVMITGEYFDPTFYNRNVYDVRTFWSWWEKFLHSQIFKTDPELVDVEGYTTSQNVTKLNTYNDLAFAAVLTIQIGSQDNLAHARAYYKSGNKAYGPTTLSSPPDTLPNVEGDLSHLSGSTSTDLPYDSKLGGYPIFFWEAPASKAYYKAIETFEEDYYHMLHSGIINSTNYISLHGYLETQVKPSDAIAQAMASQVINNQTRRLELRIPCYNVQLDVAGYFGWNVEIDRAGYWQFQYVQTAMRRDPYAGNISFQRIRQVCEVLLLICVIMKLLQLVLEYLGCTDKNRFFGACLRRIFPTTTEPDYQTGTVTVIAGIAQAITWALVTDKHDDLQNQLIYTSAEDRNSSSVSQLLVTLDSLDNMYMAYKWCVLVMFCALFVHMFNLLKFQGKLNAISLVIADTITEILWFFSCFFLGLTIFAGIFWIYYGSYLIHMNTYWGVLKRMVLMAFSLNKVTEKEIWATGSPNTAYVLALLFRVVMITVLLKMVFAIMNTQYKKNRKNLHNKANSPVDDFNQMYASWYLHWTQRKKEFFVPNSYVMKALETDAVDNKEELSVDDMYEALQEVAETLHSDIKVQPEHAEWVVAHYAMEVEKKLTSETAKKVKDLIKELKCDDAKAIKKIEKNIDFLVAAMAVKPEKKDKKDKKDGNDKKKKASAADDKDEHVEQSNSNKLKPKTNSPKLEDGLDVSTSLQVGGFNATMASINKGLNETRQKEIVHLMRRKKARHHDTTTYDEEAEENPMQKLRRRWAYLAKLDKQADKSV